jgi:hypothetical protein
MIVHRFFASATNGSGWKGETIPSIASFPLVRLQCAQLSQRIVKFENDLVLRSGQNIGAQAAGRRGAVERFKRGGDASAQKPLHRRASARGRWRVAAARR